MTSDDPTSNRQDCGSDAAPYVLGALEEHEAATFRRHLATCTVCRDEVAALQAVADALPMAAPQLIAPEGLKRRVLAGVRAQSRSASKAKAGWPRFRLSLARPALAAGALVVALAATVGVVELLSAGSASPQVVQASVTSGPGSAELHLGGGRAELTVLHMPPPPQGRIYEVWVKRSGHRQISPTNALFSVTSAGSATVDVPGGLHGVSQVMVSPEPLGGSLVPTRGPVIIAQLPEQ